MICDILFGKKHHATFVFGCRNNSSRPISKPELMKLEPTLTDFAVTNAKMYLGSWDSWSLHGARSAETWYGPSPSDLFQHLMFVTKMHMRI